MTDMLEYCFEDLSKVTSISSFQGQTGNMSAPSTWTRARYHDGDSLKIRTAKEQPRRQLQQGISHNGIVDMTPQWSIAEQLRLPFALSQVGACDTRERAFEPTTRAIAVVMWYLRDSWGSIPTDMATDEHRLTSDDSTVSQSLIVAQD